MMIRNHYSKLSLSELFAAIVLTPLLIQYTGEGERKSIFYYF